jgi:cell wall-associated NlpC family hydrolase
MGRLAAVLLVVAALVPAGAQAADARREPASSSSRSGLDSWAAPQIGSVVAAGLMGPDVTSFRPDDPITRGELFEAVTALGGAPPYPADPAAAVTMRELDAKLVGALGLGRAAWRIRVAARDAGLRPTPYLGTETVARLLGLRINHPQGEEWLERGPNQPAPRAEAAYSLARALALTPERIAVAARQVEEFSFDAMSEWERVVVTRAVRFVGFPYVFAGTSERQQKLWGAEGLVDAPAGFDCSGFVWRVYKTEAFLEAPELNGALSGRTTFDMSGEVEPTLRVGWDALRPGDVLFFGANGPRSKPKQVTHSGIYVGSGWMAHSSSNGVTLQPLEGWYANRFAWARRPLAEVGLSTF